MLVVLVSPLNWFFQIQIEDILICWLKQKNESVIRDAILKKETW